MNPRLARLLVRLYPTQWRRRYGAEFEAFLKAGEGGLGALANVGCSAFCERIVPAVPTQGALIGPGAGSLRFRSWCVRAPWAIFGVGPFFLLAGAYFVALFLLWFGWKIFLPGADSPFGAPVHGLENLYFQAARFLYFGAPVFVGWVFGVAAARQKVKAVWLSVGLVPIALLAAMSHVHAGRTEVPRGLGHISMGIAFGTSVTSVYGELFYAFVILTLGVLPYFLWRLQRARSIA